MRRRRRPAAGTPRGAMLSVVTSLFFLVSSASGAADWAAMGKSLDPSGAILYSWNGAGPPCNGEDTPYLGLSCDANAQVVGLSLPFRGLTGSIPPALASVDTLTTVNLNNNELQGNLPDNMNDLANLVVMVACCNNLGGAIPNIPALDKLTVLDLSNNQISGSIPETLSGLTSVKNLELNTNHLEGTIPAGLGNLKQMTSLSLNNNQLLTGPVPAPVAYLARPGSVFNFSDNPGMCGPRSFGLTPCQIPSPPPPASGTVLAAAPASSFTPTPPSGTQVSDGSSGGGTNTTYNSGSTNSTAAASSGSPSSPAPSQGIIGPLTLPMLIGIGAVLMALLLLGLLLIFCCCRRRKHKGDKVAAGGGKGSAALAAEGAVVAAAVSRAPEGGGGTGGGSKGSAAASLEAPTQPASVVAGGVPPAGLAPPAARSAAVAAPAVGLSPVSPAAVATGVALASVPVAAVSAASVASARTSSARNASARSPSPRFAGVAAGPAPLIPAEKPGDMVVTVEDEEPKWSTPKWSTGSRGSAGSSPVVVAAAGAAALGATPGERQRKEEEVDVEAGQSGGFGSFMGPAPPPAGSASRMPPAAAAGVALAASAAVGGVAALALGSTKQEKESSELQQKSAEVSDVPSQTPAPGSVPEEPTASSGGQGLGVAAVVSGPGAAVSAGAVASSSKPRSPVAAGRVRPTSPVAADAGIVAPAPAGDTSSEGFSAPAVPLEDSAPTAGMAAAMGLWMSGLAGGWSKKDEVSDTEASPADSVANGPVQAVVSVPAPSPASGGPSSTLRFYPRDGADAGITVGGGPAAAEKMHGEDDDEGTDDASSGGGHGVVDPAGSVAEGPDGNNPALINPPGGVPLPVLRSLSAAYLREDGTLLNTGSAEGTNVEPSLGSDGTAAVAAVGWPASAVPVGGSLGSNSSRSPTVSDNWGQAGAPARLPDVAEDESEMHLASSAPLVVPREPERVVVMPPVVPPSQEVRDEEDGEEGTEDDEEDDDEDEGAEGPRWYTTNDLAQATLGFADATVLGSGRFGTVYRATFADGTDVAVKRLAPGSHLNQSLREFKFEVDTMVGLSQHANLVALLGACASEVNNERMLVYEYLPNGTLDALLHPSGESSSYTYAPSHTANAGGAAPPSPRSVLSWPMRMHIALGCARGLAHLHEGLDVKVVHRDVKASNVLLDANWEAKLGDYALAKILGKDEPQAKARIMGTFGYVAPEYLNSGILTERSDVYSFGVLLLEIITGRRPVENGAPPDEADTVQWVKRIADEGALEAVVDRRLLPVGGVATDDAEYVLSLALRCVETNALKRPKMTQVVKMLESEDVIVNGEEPMTPSSAMVWSSSPHAPGSSGGYGGSYMQNPYAGGMVSPRAPERESPRAADAYQYATLGGSGGRTSPSAGGPLYTGSQFGGTMSPRTAGLGYTSSTGNNGRLVRPNSAGAATSRSHQYPASPYTTRYGTTGAYASGGVHSPTTPGGSVTPLGGRRSTSPRHASNDVGSLIANAAYKATSPRASQGFVSSYHPDSPSGMRSAGRQYSSTSGNRSPSERESHATGSLIASHAMGLGSSTNRQKTSPRGPQGY